MMKVSLSLSLSRKSMVRLTDHRDMTIAVSWDIKPLTKQKNNFAFVCCILVNWKDKFKYLKHSNRQ